MLEPLLARVRDQWPGWFDVRSAPSLDPLLLAGGPAHRDRVSIVVFAGRERRPRVIMKVGFSVREGAFLESEYRAMSTLRPQLPSALAGAMPRALDLYRSGRVTALSAEVLPGRRLLVPSLVGDVSRAARRMMDSLFRESFTFSRELARVTSSGTRRGADDLVEVIERFGRMFCSGDPSADGAVRSFAGSVGQADIDWRPAWQHQDIAVGNVLEQRGRLVFVDWEHGSDGCQPWFDVAYTPMVTAHLAKRVDSLPTIETAASAVLGSDTPIGSILQARMEEVWDYPLPLPWAVCLTTMIGAMRRLEDDRTVSPEWADFVKAMLTDEGFRTRLSWLAPQW